VFVTSWGKTVSLNRDEVVGIVHANDSLTLLHDDFDAPLKTWRLDGNPILTQEKAFFGKSVCSSTVRGNRLSAMAASAGRRRDTAILSRF